MWNIWANLLLPEALKSCPKFNKLPIPTSHNELATYLWLVADCCIAVEIGMSTSLRNAVVSQTMQLIAASLNESLVAHSKNVLY